MAAPLGRNTLGTCLLVQVHLHCGWVAESRDQQHEGLVRSSLRAIAVTKLQISVSPQTGAPRFTAPSHARTPPPAFLQRPGRNAQIHMDSCRYDIPGFEIRRLR